MPARAFLLFGQLRALLAEFGGTTVSMPARAFLLFGPSFAAYLVGSHANGFNAREGIFAFRTRLAVEVRDFTILRFNAREGIFAFRTCVMCAG